MRKFFQFVLFVLLVISFLIFINALIPLPKQPPKISPTPKPLPTRAETYSDLNLARQWSYSFGSGCYIDNPNCLYIDNDRVILLYSDLLDFWPIIENKNQSELVSLSLENGSVIWQVTVKDEHWGVRPDDGWVDSAARRLYLTYGFRVHAINLDTGQAIWSTKELPSHNGYYFDPTRFDPLRVYSTESDTRYDLDAETGEILQEQKEEMPSLLNEKWRTIPFQNGQISAEGWIFNMLYARDAYGREIWRSGEYFSNAALIGEHVYAIDVQGDLVALDAGTGWRLGSMKFSVPLKEIQPEGEHGWGEGYYVFSQGPYLLITASDNHELMVYKEQ